MPRDNPEGSSSRCSAAREAILSRCGLRGKSHRTIDPHALKNPRPAGAESTLAENVASPFHAEPRQDEQVFRYNNRGTEDNPLNDADRFDAAVRQIVGKRLTYKELTGKDAERPASAEPF